MGPSKLDTSILMSRPRTSTLNSLRARIHRQQQEEGRRLSLFSRPSSKSSRHSTPSSRTETKETPSQGEVAQVVHLSDQVDQCPTRKGNRSPRRLAERIITGASETMLTSPSGFVMNLPSAVDLTIRRKERCCQACLRIEERIWIKDAKSVKWSSAMRATLVYRG
jgi:hypothetical protein